MGLDLIDRLPEELWRKVCKKKNCKKAKWLSEEALQIAVKRREAKGKGEKEKYTHLNAEFQRIARRDKKAFLRDQCKEIEENNRMGREEKGSRSVRSDSLRPHGLQPARLLHPWDFPGKNTGVGCHRLFWNPPLTHPNNNNDTQ